jgi:hypothetical protein
VQNASTTEAERRHGTDDRRKRSRNGRRAGDPDGARHWRRFAWMFAMYAACVSVRSLPAVIKKRFGRTPMIF